MNNGRDAFERVLNTPRCASPAPVFDPISARIAEELGFEVGLLAGSSASLQILGAPDLVLVTLSELAEQTRRITRASSLPLLVDADHGFGNALNVMRTVRELALAGAAAVTIEDTLIPPAFGRFGLSEQISLEEMLGKLRAACSACGDAAIAVVARTDLSASGIEEGVARIREYSKEAVSAVFVSGVKSRADVEAISAATHLPLLLGVIPDAVRDCDYLAAKRVRLFNRGHQPLMAAIQATYDAMAELKNGPASGAPLRMAPKDMLERLSGASRYREWAADFL